MAEPDSLTVWTRGEGQTLGLGEALGRHLGTGAVVALRGELGSGKTRLVQGIARGLEVSPSDRVSSPSFALIHEHAGRIRLYHMDFYRLAAGGWEPDLGLEEYLLGDGACVIEWAERIEELLPQDRLDVFLTIEGASKRKIELVARGERHGKGVEALRKALDRVQGARELSEGDFFHPRPTGERGG